MPVQRCVQPSPQVVGKYGRIDVLILNAAIQASRSGRLCPEATLGGMYCYRQLRLV